MSCQKPLKQDIYAIPSKPELFISYINGNHTVVKLNPDFEKDIDTIDKDGTPKTDKYYIPADETEYTQKIINDFSNSRGGSARKTRRKLNRGGERKKKTPEPNKPIRKTRVPAKKATKGGEYVKRKNTVAQATELIVCIVLSLFNNGNQIALLNIEREIGRMYQLNITDAIPSMYGANSDKIRDYIIDLKARPKVKMLAYARHFFDNLEEIGIGSIRDVRLLGIGSDIENKSDVTCNGKIGVETTKIGFSVKMGKPTKINAALSNIQEKIVVVGGRLDIIGLKSAAVDQFFIENVHIEQTGKTDGKTYRDDFNGFFVNMQLPMWQQYNQWILENSHNIAHYIANCLYSQFSDFPVYECSDTTLVHLNKYDVISATLVTTNRWDTGNVAKLFYVLSINVKETATEEESNINLKIELRFKSGNYCDGSSPQFFAFELPV